MASTRTPGLPLAAALVALAGCATPRLEAQWSDPARGEHALRGARVMIACEAYEQVLKQVCQDQLAAELQARGAIAVVGPDTSNPAPGRPLDDQQYLGAARSAGARALLVSYITPSASNVNPGFSIGIGGSTWGSGSGGGVGISMPVGGGQVETGYSANTRITDVASGKLLWTAKASAPPSSDLNTQLGQLHKLVFEAADKAVMF